MRPDATIAPARGGSITSLRCHGGEPVELDPVNTGERSSQMHAVRFRPIPFVSILLLACAPVVRAAEDTGEDVLGEVVVTGTLRGDRLGEVPASVTVLRAGTLRDAGQQHFEDVLGLVANLNWAGG